MRHASHETHLSTPAHLLTPPPPAPTHRALHKRGGDDEQQQLAVPGHPPDVAAGPQVGRQLVALRGGRRVWWVGGYEDGARKGCGRPHSLAHTSLKP